ncbi:histidinol-phosphatase (PHP family) [Lederbergia galactosidilyticus]|uniref:histidinol-phosphatase n=1 Tax=Lederbergia galactosidilytica TaxID=217031 RepID=UPI000ADE8F89|nr:histidinol-phosphatase [Lederbergia galactosidilytica]MBP1916481.1 histidinol-phosphatase (PHP family) [Lederbergia galactosidilytica]
MSTNIKFDFHTHHDRCGHARGKIRDYIEAAIANGLNMIGISDHSPYFASEEDQAHPGIAMAKSSFATYVEEVLALKEEYKTKIDVLLGVESDFFPEHIPLYRKQYAQYPFDYIIGSVHHVNGINIFNRDRWDGLTKEEIKQTKDRYYDLIAQSAQSGLFQILGHIDAMKGFYPVFSQIETEEIERALKIIGEYPVAIEINTSGKTKDCGGWYPSDEILEKALYYGVKVTFGSDAHDPERVGDDMEEVRQRLKEIGFNDWAYFKEQQMVLTSL